MNKRISLTTAVIMVLVLLTACAPAQPEATPSPSPIVTPSPVPTPEPTDDDTEEGEVGEVTTPEGLEDGVYVGNSEEDDRGNYGEIRITIADEKITDVEFIEYTGDGKPKSAETGYEYEEALQAIEELPQQLIETQDVDQIDDFSGATGTTEKFRTAAKKALSGEPKEGGPEQQEDGNEDNETQDNAGSADEG
ncbi:MAG: FMN-binding protein [Caldicoprobacterales bacterium]|nr:FMN-binding protein [Clostridiales bacterium]